MILIRIIGGSASSGGAIVFAIATLFALFGWIEYGFWATFLSVVLLLILNVAFILAVFKIADLIGCSFACVLILYFIVGYILLSDIPGSRGIIETIFKSFITPPLEYLKFNWYIFNHIVNYLGGEFGTLRAGRSLLDMLTSST